MSLSTLEAEFSSASEQVSSGAVGGLSRGDQLELYGLYSVAKKGVAPSNAPTSVFDPRGHAKWHAWRLKSSLTKTEAMVQYVELVRKLESLSQEEKAKNESDDDDMGNDASIKGFTVSEPTNRQQRFDLTHWASVNDTKSMRFCLEKQQVSPDYRDEDGLTALMRAADRGATEAVRVLLEVGANVHVTDPEGQTALHYAALCDQSRVAGLLAEAGANASARDNDGQSALDTASDEVREALTAVANGTWRDTGSPQDVTASPTLISYSTCTSPLITVAIAVGIVAMVWAFISQREW